MLGRVPIRLEEAAGRQLAREVDEPVRTSCRNSKTGRLRNLQVQRCDLSVNKVAAIERLRDDPKTSDFPIKFDRQSITGTEIAVEIG